MNFKKHKCCFAASLSLVAALLFTGCGKETAAAPSSQNGANLLPGQSMSELSGAAVASAVAAPVQNLSMLSTMFGVDTGCATENGYYELDLFQSPIVLTYTDYATCQRVPLCARPECMHADESCSAVLEGAAGIISLNEHLYVFLASEDGKRSILKMNFDGSGQETVAVLNSADSYRGGFAGAQEFLFTVAQVYHAENRMQTPELIQIDLTNGTIQTLEKLNSSQSWYLVGAFGETLLLKSIEQSADAPAGSQNAYESQHHTLFLYTLSTGQWTTLSSWMQDERIDVCYEDLLILYDPAAAVFSVERLHADGTQTILTSDPLPMKNARDAYFYGFYDGRVVVELGENIAPDGSSPDYRWRMFAVSTQDGAVAELTLQQTYKGVGEFIRPLAGSNGTLLVKYGVKEESRIAEGADGSLEQYSAIVPVFAMIDSTDFFSNNPRFREVT